MTIHRAEHRRPSGAAGRPRVRIGFVVALAMALHWFMAVSVSPRIGVTADEVVHLTGGYSYWKFNDYRLHPENGTVPMRLAALPLLGMDVKFPPLDDRQWLHSQVNLVGEKFFFALGNPVDLMLWRARLMIGFVGALCVWLTWRWARGLFGPTAGWVALGLATFCPALLAHAGLATSDMTMTVAVVGALSLVWRMLHRATWLNVAAATLACGLAFLSKMSGVLIAPLIAVMLLARWSRSAPYVLMLGRRPRWLRRRMQIIAATLGVTMATAAGSLGVLWAGYGFRFSGFNRGVSEANGYYFSWDVILDREPLPQPEGGSVEALMSQGRPRQETSMTRLVAWVRDHRLLPEAYLWGFAHTYKFSRYRSAFFNGQYRTTGWREFFPVAFLLKTTLPALLLIAIGAAALACRAGKSGGNGAPKAWLYRATPLVLFFVVYWAMAINMNLNIGHRHILPTYPVFYVMASAAVLWLQSNAHRAVAFGLCAALVLHAADSLGVRPFYLSYFQPLAGGMAGGHRYLVDSSFDWGQGLPELERWLEQKKVRGDDRPVFLTYFGADSPRARGLDVVRFGDEVTDTGERSFPAYVRGGWFVIGATHFRRVYLPVRGPWTPDLERLYRTIEARLLAVRRAPRSAEDRRLLLQDARDFELLQFGRLAYYLENRTPREVIGGSLLAFELTDQEVRFALNAPLQDLERGRLALATR